MCELATIINSNFSFSNHHKYLWNFDYF